MYHRIVTVSKLWFLAGCLVSLMSLSGCQTPVHTNTLIFGTNTKFALDISEDPTGVASITLGYKRQEAVWMPLLANEDSKGVPAKCGDDCLFVGTRDPGPPEKEKDTYSVLASFGAEFSTGTKAAGGLAQYFATGLAARNLAANDNVAQTLSVSSFDQTMMNEYKKLYEKASRDADKTIKSEDEKIKFIIGKIAPNESIDSVKLEQLLGSPRLKDISETHKQRMREANSPEQLRECLINAQSTIDPIYEALN